MLVRLFHSRSQPILLSVTTRDGIILAHLSSMPLTPPIHPDVKSKFKWVGLAVLTIYLRVSWDLRPNIVGRTLQWFGESGSPTIQLGRQDDTISSPSSSCCRSEMLLLCLIKARDG